MKRKRGPAPNGRQGREKNSKNRKGEEGELVGEELDEESSFKGFSEDEQKDQEIQVNGKTVTNGHGTKGILKKQKRGAKNVPTEEELTESFFQSSSFQSNLFKLQVGELLAEVRVKYDKMEKMEQVLHQLKAILTKLPESEEQLVFPQITGLTAATRI
jgi:U3 small nucleolar RNA-associated protein 22